MVCWGFVGGFGNLRMQQTPTTVLAYRWVAPLLIENVATTAYLDQSPGSGLRASVPEITSVGDAVMFAAVECHLTALQQAKLKKLLIVALKD